MDSLPIHYRITIQRLVEEIKNNTSSIERLCETIKNIHEKGYIDDEEMYKWYLAEDYRKVPIIRDTCSKEIKQRYELRDIKDHLIV